MVASWLPDPPVGRSNDEISTISVPTVFIDSDTDDQELNVGDENVIENGGYRLLNDHDNHLDENHEESEDDTSNLPSEPAQTVQSSSSSDLTVSNSSVLVAESAVTQENAEARDINVDYDQVRAVMAHVTLPASATPSWASAIPDSEWCSFLQNRIRTLQGRNELDSEKH